jgi:hypothetical protein
MTAAEQHYSCMDVLHIKSSIGSEAHCDCGVLLEVWSTGGLIHADEPLPRGEQFTVSYEGGQVDAEVVRYEQDEFGCYIEFAVRQPWFPDSYHPQYLQAQPETQFAHAS